MYHQRRAGQRSLFSIAGWLFADLLLALAVIFISANTIGAKTPVVAKPTPTPTFTPIPTPTPLPSLEQAYHRYTLTIDPSGLLQNNAGAIAQVKRQVKSEAQLQGRSAGLVIAYGGAPSAGQIGEAKDIATKILVILRDMGKHDHFVFFTTSYYDPLFLLYSSEAIVVIDVYLFAQ